MLLFLLPLFILPITCILLYVKNKLASDGFTIFNIFILAYTLFYLIVPFVHLFFKNYRDNLSLYTIVLNTVKDETIILNYLLTLVLLLVIIFGYKISFSKSSL